MEPQLSPIVIEGLRNLGTTIPLDISKKLIAHSIKASLHPETTLPPVPEIFATNGDVSKQSAYAIVTSFVLAMKHSYDAAAFSKMLKPYTSEEIISEMTSQYEEHRRNLFMRQVQIGQSFPHATNLQWRLLCDVKSSSSEASSKELCFQIDLGNFNEKGERNSITQFVCNTEELQLLLNKLKEIERHGLKVAGQ